MKNPLPKSVTLTGLDERTDMKAIVLLWEKRPLPFKLEFGILYSATRAGRDPRYPSGEVISRILDTMPMQTCALHLCGTDARENFWRGDLDEWMPSLNRLQINGTLTPGQLRTALGRSPVPVITQHNFANAELTNVDLSTLKGEHQLLVDASGGKGMLPATWAAPMTIKQAGYAGGLTPENIAEEVIKIASVAKGAWWIDVESGIRSPGENAKEDWFSAEKAHEFVARLVASAGAGRWWVDPLSQ